MSLSLAVTRLLITAIYSINAIVGNTPLSMVSTDYGYYAKWIAGAAALFYHADLLTALGGLPSQLPALVSVLTAMNATVLASTGLGILPIGAAVCLMGSLAWDFANWINEGSEIPFAAKAPAWR